MKTVLLVTALSWSVWGDSDDLTGLPDSILNMTILDDTVQNLTVCDLKFYNPMDTSPDTKITPDSAATLTVSQTSIYSHQYLRVTLKSVYIITGFVIKAVDNLDSHDAGNE